MEFTGREQHFIATDMMGNQERSFTNDLHAIITNRIQLK